jgi:hypothetical protein
LLKRSLFFYALLAIVFLKVDHNSIHYRRLGYLRYLYMEAGQGKNIPAGIVYYDYLRRLDPADITVWVDLVNAYLSAHEPAKALEAVRYALSITPKESVNYPLLLTLYQNIELN